MNIIGIMDINEQCVLQDETMTLRLIFLKIYFFKLVDIQIWGYIFLVSERDLKSK